jgi:methionyl-tRNA formyltransferase
MNQSTLIILTERGFLATLEAVIESLNFPHKPQIKTAETLQDIETALSNVTGPCRLVAFCTGVIIPNPVLKALSSGAYNFHPGPPAYPGLFPSCFAIYDGAEIFGATAHRMTEQVDGGEIVGTRLASLMPWADRLAADTLAFECVTKLFARLAPDLLNLEAPLVPSGEVWSGRARTRKDFEDLCQLPSDLSEEEFQKRYRAVGEGPDHALTLTLFGHRFKLDNNRDQETVVRGGKSKS